MRVVIALPMQQIKQIVVDYLHTTGISTNACVQDLVFDNLSHEMTLEGDAIINLSKVMGVIGDID
jgi:hypothetical protein